MFHVPELFRVLASDARYGNNGAFAVKLKHHQTVHVIASDELGWEHVSVSRKDRLPTWDELRQVKNIFWDDEDCVVLYFPKLSEYANDHPFCMHLWRPTDVELPRPNMLLV
jgi:hypothetical protein